MAALEGGKAAIAASSGQAAQFMTFAALAHAGDNIVSTSNLYGGTYNQLKVFLPRLGIKTKFVTGDRPEDFAKLIDDNTKAVYIESIGNPRYNVPDFEKVCQLAHEKGVPVVVSRRGRDRRGFVANLPPPLRSTTPSGPAGTAASRGNSGSLPCWTENGETLVWLPTAKPVPVR